jgi:hypothetical protein
MSIANHTPTSNNPVNYSNPFANTERVKNFVKRLHDFLPNLEQEYESLKTLQAKKPNEKFPIKMDNLAAIYQAAGPLYDLYITQAPNSNN